jgi:hypothetical protein
MARVETFYVANPTTEDLETVKGKVKCPAGKVTKLEVDTEAGKNVDDLLEVIDRGCTVSTGLLVNKVAKYEGKTRDLVSLIEAGAKLLQVQAKAVISAGADAFGKQGL